MHERRKYVRTRVQKRATILIENSSAIDCTVWNLTNAGAGIQIPDAICLPEALNLTFDAGRSIRSCRLAWRTLNKVGVEFC